MSSLFDFDRPYFKVGSFVIGVDEAGRGPLAGPVTAAACHLPQEFCHELICDSKKLSESKLLYLEELLKSTPGVFFALGWASAREIEELNIYHASKVAMHRAIDGLASCGKKADMILVDAMPLEKELATVHSFIKGDSKSQVIAAASILAKCARDRRMNELDKLYPGYGFAKHKGYPTKFHLEALAKLGPCPEHRKTYGPVQRVLCGEQASLVQSEFLFS